MEHPGTAAGENAGATSKPTPPDAPLHEGGIEETRKAGAVHSVEESEGGGKDERAGGPERPESGR